MTEIILAFSLVLAASMLIFIFGWAFSPKSAKNGDKESSYACGEKADFRKIGVILSLPRYLIYFVILDASVLLIAFASLAFSNLNITCLFIYLLLVLTATFVLFGGGET